MRSWAAASTEQHQGDGGGVMSTDGQTPGGTERSFYGCTKIFAEKNSGAKSDRPQLAKLLKAIGEGDTVTVTRLDRLAHPTRDLPHGRIAFINARPCDLADLVT
jgi:DNA invertase Pin-like site-specific DNA recombinase